MEEKKYDNEYYSLNKNIKILTENILNYKGGNITLENVLKNIDNIINKINPIINVYKMMRGSFLVDGFFGFNQKFCMGYGMYDYDADEKVICWNHFSIVGQNKELFDYDFSMLDDIFDMINKLYDNKDIGDELYAHISSLILKKHDVKGFLIHKNFNYMNQKIKFKEELLMGLKKFLLII